MNNNQHTISMGLFKAALTSPDGQKLSSGKGTHYPALDYVNQLVRHTQDVEFIESIVKSRLPEDYSGNTLKEVREMVRSAIKKGLHKSKNKPASDEKQSTEALTELEKLGMELFNDKLGNSYAAFNDLVNGCIAILVRSSDMKRRVQLAYFEAKETAISHSSLSEVIDTLDAQARFRSPTLDVHIRVAELDGVVYIDRGTSIDSFIKITGDGYQVCESVPVKFRRSLGFEELPLPEPDFEPMDMQELLGMDDDNFVLFVAFLLICLNPLGPYMLLLVLGAQGSGKSKLCELINTIIDPSAVSKQRIPNNEHNLVIHAQDNRLLVYDNASTISSDMSDAMCTLSTGGAFVTRKLYTDAESQLFEHMRPIVINGIGDLAYRPDLLERSIQLNMPAIPAQKRRTERELDQEFRELLPGFLGYLYKCVAHALANLDAVEPPRSIRMADAAHWLVAAEPATGFKQGQFLQALEQVQHEIMVDRAVNDTLALALTKVLKDRPGNEFEGLVSELFEELQEVAYEQRLGLPKSPSALSNALKRSEAMLARICLMIEFGARSNRGSIVRVWQANRTGDEQ